MLEFIKLCLGLSLSVFKSRAALQTENLALRHQLCVYQRSIKRGPAAEAFCCSSATRRVMRRRSAPNSSPTHPTIGPACSTSR